MTFLSKIFQAPDRYYIAVGEQVAKYIDGFDDGKLKKGVFRQTGMSQGSHDVFSINTQAKGFEKFKTDLLANYTSSNWREQNADKPYEADLYSLLENFENPDTFTVILPADEETAALLTSVFQEDAVDEGPYPDPAYHTLNKIRISFNRNELTEIQKGRLDQFYDEIKQRKLSRGDLINTFNSPDFLNLYNFAKKHKAPPQEGPANQPPPSDSDPSGIPVDSDPMSGVMAAQTEQEKPEFELTPIDEILYLDPSSEATTEFYKPLSDIEAGYEEIVDDLNPQFGNLSNQKVYEDALRRQYTAKGDLQMLGLELESLLSTALASTTGVFAEDTEKSTFLLRVLTIQEMIAREFGGENPPLANGEVSIDWDQELDPKELKQLRKELGLSKRLIASLEGIPLSAIQDYVFSREMEQSYLSWYAAAMELKKARDEGRSPVTSRVGALAEPGVERDDSEGQIEIETQVYRPVQELLTIRRGSGRRAKEWMTGEEMARLLTHIQEQVLSSYRDILAELEENESLSEEHKKFSLDLGLAIFTEDDEKKTQFLVTVANEEEIELVRAGVDKLIDDLEIAINEYPLPNRIVDLEMIYYLEVTDHGPIINVPPEWDEFIQGLKGTDR